VAENWSDATLKWGDADIRRITTLANEARRRRHCHGELLELIRLAMPEWAEHEELPLAEALRQFWPGGG
jgi:hypothetical protein